MTDDQTGKSPPDQEPVRDTLYRRPGSDQLDHIETALKKNPADPGLLHWYGFTLYSLHRFAEAVEVYLRALELDPSSSASHYYVGNSLYRLGRVEEAVTAWKRVLSLKPDGREGRRARERLIEHDPGFQAEHSTDREAAPSETHAEELTRLGELVRREKMEALTSMAQGICHELNNPLMVVTGFAELLVSNMVSDDAVLRAMPAKIRDTGQRCIEVIRRFSNFAIRVGQESTREIDVSALLEEVLGILRAAFRSQGIQVVTRLEAGLLIRNSEPTALQLALMSLLDNARRAMPQGGLLEVTAHRHGTEAAISISDNGDGMSQKEISRIFEPFYTKKKEWTSLGLGLAEAYATITRHSGTISCESTEGAGATFRVRIPVLTGVPTATEVAIPPRACRSRSVLIIDEDYDVLYLAARILERDGYKATLTPDGVAALSSLTEGQYALVIADPVVWGPFLADGLNALRAKDAMLPMLLTPGVASSPDFATRMAIGAVRILQKPYSFEELAREARHMISGCPPLEGE